MPDLTKTWTWDASLEGFAITQGANNIAVRDAAVGSPTVGCLKDTITGRNKTTGSLFSLTGITWEDLDAALVGATITDVQVVGVMTQTGLDIWNVMDAMNYEVSIRDGATNLLDVGTGPLLTRADTGVTGWLSNSPASQAVGAGYQASTTPIVIEVSISGDTGKDGAASGSGHFDNLGLFITYTEGGEPPVTRRIFIT